MQQTGSQDNRPAAGKCGVREPSGLLARLPYMKRAPAIIHATAMVILFATLGQPGAIEKPAGVRRAVETTAGAVKNKAFLETSQRKIRVPANA